MLMETKKIIYGIMILWGIFSCTRTIKNEYGPSICPSNNYKITSDLKLSTSAIDFTKTDSLKIDAELNEIVSWTVQIKGKTSNAVRTFSGRSSAINVIWYGEPNAGPFFIGGESCSIDLSLNCEGIVQSSNIDILKTGNFSKTGYLVWDFDNNQIPIQEGSGASEQFERLLISPEESTLPLSPQGGKYIKLSGSHIAGLGWYYGYTGGDVSGASLAKLSTDPEKLFVNFFYNLNGLNNTDLYFKITGGTTHSKDGDAIRIKPVPAGWTLVSFPLSDVNVLNVSAITNFSFSLNTTVQNQAAEANIDFVIITKDKPFGQ